MVEPRLPPCSSKQVSTALQKRQLSAEAVKCKVFRLLLHLSAKEKGHCLVWVPVLLFCDRIPDCGHLFNIPVSCFIQLLFHSRRISGESIRADPFPPKKLPFKSQIPAKAVNSHFLLQSPLLPALLLQSPHCAYREIHSHLLTG